MLVAIAGGHGKIARQLGALLAADGHEVRGLIRNPDHAADLEAIGVAPVHADLEADEPGLAEHIRGADAVVFAAGAGPGSGAERKQTMDRDGAVKLIDACHAAGVRRYVMVSAIGARDGGGGGDDVFAAYLRAKAEADRALEQSGLDYTIVRPGGLTDAPGTGRITLADRLTGGSVARADIAATLAAVLDAPNTIGRAFDVVGGSTPIRDAVASV
jgi:uncharacterized protein YbjT (DUF2867 family)